MKEFMLLIHNQIDHQSGWTADQHAQFLKKCEKYIGELKEKGQLITAQPLVREGMIIAGKNGQWKEDPINETAEVQVGYYHILAKDLEEAAHIAKRNPEFEFGSTARIEVRPVKTKEDTTGFVYPGASPATALGEITAVTISSPDLERSLSFYQMLGFKEVLQANMPFPWIQVSDGALLIMLREERTPYIALTYYVKDIDQKVAELEDAGIKFITKAKAGDMIKRFLLKSPDGMNVSLVSFVEGFKQPKGHTMLTMPPADLNNPATYGNKVCGMFGELAHPVKDIDVSMVFWEKLGFKILSRMSSPYPWAIISDGLAIVGLHQSTNFSEPTITFFAADMKDKIEHLVQKGLTDFHPLGGENNVVLKTPEGQHINLFKLGM